MRIKPLELSYLEYEYNRSIRALRSFKNAWSAIDLMDNNKEYPIEDIDNTIQKLQNGESIIDKKSGLLLVKGVNKVALFEREMFGIPAPKISSEEKVMVDSKEISIDEIFDKCSFNELKNIDKLKEEFDKNEKFINIYNEHTKGDSVSSWKELSIKDQFELLKDLEEFDGIKLNSHKRIKRIEENLPSIDSLSPEIRKIVVAINKIIPGQNEYGHIVSLFKNVAEDASKNKVKKDAWDVWAGLENLVARAANILQENSKNDFNSHDVSWTHWFKEEEEFFLENEVDIDEVNPIFIKKSIDTKKLMDIIISNRLEDKFDIQWGSKPLVAKEHIGSIKFITEVYAEKRAILKSKREEKPTLSQRESILRNRGVSPETTKKTTRINNMRLLRTP